jgi:hypothetical protein
VAAARHYITSISASFIDAASAEKELTLQIDGSPVAVYAVKAERDITFDPPLAAGEDEDVSVMLAAGGSGISGHVVLVGFSL